MRFVKLSTLIVLATFPAVAQNPPPATRGSSTATSKTSQMLPRSCLAKQHPSEQVSALFETIRDHPTAGAYNTLGVLYAQADRVACAISAFEAALHLESQNWQAHYNLALALLRKGDPPRAESELRAALRQKPDSAAAHFALGTLLQDEQKLDDIICEDEEDEKKKKAIKACFAQIEKINNWLSFIVGRVGQFLQG